MARHSHWATIKHKKGLLDKKKGKLISMLARLIISAARQKGGDPDMNPTLRDLLDKAKSANMTRDQVERAIKKGTGELEGAIPEQMIYEAYGPGGVAILLEILTDNRTRTAGELRVLLEHHGGKLAASNSVAWLFDVKGLLTVPKSAIPEDDLIGLAADAGADDVRAEGDVFEVVTPPESLEAVKAALAAKKLKWTSADVTRVPKNLVPLQGDAARKVLALVSELDDHDDVSAVHTNFDVPEEILAEAGKG
ncbi:MAG: YebC/PmpR family DNA-binding transcriptional regulator [Planctomycetales bacterium]|nr:YebC/PmpR family DNA-binding transcriptional regulator [Planctomycetales bacterium]